MGPVTAARTPGNFSNREAHLDLIRVQLLEAIQHISRSIHGRLYRVTHTDCGLSHTYRLVALGRVDLEADLDVVRT
jgi:hypothetical protein